GTFYDMKKGGSVCYLQIDGVVADTTKGKDMKVRANGAVVIKKGKLSVEPWSPDREKEFRANLKKKTSVMATMPLLIKDGYAVELPYYKGFSDKRHPRSVVFEKDGKICLMVIDGRSKGNAAGMTLDEVQRYLLSMGGKGCTAAVNLDGGGSSTLWLKEGGVINHPSDNGKFDHKGERRVANSIIVLQ
ncbi:MAG: phosphodiester glycosidase family protein, partial [Bacteroidales bacterium]|nr:phosphodiester glycosidase family protein [Bacteroidales bacterium]